MACPAAAAAAAAAAAGRGSIRAIALRRRQLLLALAGASTLPLISSRAARLSRDTSLSQDGNACVADTFCPFYRPGTPGGGRNLQSPAETRPSAKISLNSLPWCHFASNGQNDGKRKLYCCGVCKGLYKAHQYAQHVRYRPPLMFRAGLTSIACIILKFVRHLQNLFAVHEASADPAVASPRPSRC
jgi:hypothetical protein